MVNKSRLATPDTYVPFAGESRTQGRQMGNDLLWNPCLIGDSQMFKSGILSKPISEVKILILLPNACCCFDDCPQGILLSVSDGYRYPMEQPTTFSAHASPPHLLANACASDSHAVCQVVL